MESKITSNNDTKVNTPGASHSSAPVFTAKTLRNVEACRETLKAWCDCADVKFDWIVSKRKTNDRVIQRDKAYIFLRERGFSYPVIGKVFKRNHATIIFSIRKGSL